MKRIAYSLLFLCMVHVLAGCTLIGFGIGALADPGPARDSVSIFHDIHRNEGAKVRIQYLDLSLRYATYTGYGDEPDTEYRNDYMDFVKHHSENPAAIRYGDTVIVQAVTDTKGIFAGYFPEGIFLQNQKLYFEDFDNIISPKFLKERILKEIFEENAVPIRGELHFHDYNNSFSLTNRDFRKITVLPQSAPGRWIGLGIGAAVDIAFIAVLAYKISPAHGGNGSFLSARPIGIGVR